MDVKIEDFLKLVETEGILVSNYDLIYACTDIAFQQKISDYAVGKNLISHDELVKLVTENRDKFNINKLLTNGISNKELYLKKLKERIEETKSECAQYTGLESIKANIELKTMEADYQQETKALAELRKRYRGLDVCTATSIYNTQKNEPSLHIVDSNIIINQKKPNKEKKLKKFDELSSRLQKIQGESGNGLQMLFYSLTITEIISIFPNEEFREAVYDYCISKRICQSGIRNVDELYAEREDINAFYDKYVTGQEGDFILKTVYPTIRNYIEYVDVDRLVMTSAYKLEKILEKDKYSKEENEAIRQLVTEILDYCKENKVSDNYKLKILGKKDAFSLSETVDYSPEDIRKMLKRFQGEKYFSKSDLEKIRNAVSEEAIYLEDVPRKLLNQIYEQDEYDELLFSNDKNFKFLKSLAQMGKEEVTNEDIIDIAILVGANNINTLNILYNNEVANLEDIAGLYIDNHVDKKVLLEFLNGKNKEPLIDPESLIELYQESKYDESIKGAYDTYLDLYKELIAQIIKESPQTPEDEIRKKFSEKLMDKIAEKYDPEKEDRNQHIELLENFYKEGLLQIENIISWEDKSIIVRFLQDKVIDSTTIKDLMHKKVISQDYAKEIIGEILGKSLLNPEMDSETRMRHIKSGLVPEEYIGKLYQNLLINSLQAEELENEGFFERKKYDVTSVEEMQEKAKIKLGDLRSLTKIRGEASENPHGNKGVTYPHISKGILIEPDAREKLFELLKAKRAESLEIQENDAFYNYEFYVLPDKKGKYALDSVVIAERYFVDKDNPKEFATGNATYFFKWRDLLYISNLRKSEIAKESKNIVFRANHRTYSSDDTTGKDKAGSWGTSVITAIGKTMMGKEVEKYSKKKAEEKAEEKVKALYSVDEWTKINEHAANINCGDYNFKNPAQNSSDDSNPGGDGLR